MYGIFLSKVLPNTTEPLGVMILKSRGFFPHAYWYWIGVGALLAFVMFFNFCFTLALSFLKREYFVLNKIMSANIERLCSEI